MIEMGTCFFDEAQCRFLTVDAVGADPNCYCCIQEEIEYGSDLVATGRVWMMASELLKLQEV